MSSISSVSSSSHAAFIQSARDGASRPPRLEPTGEQRAAFESKLRTAAQEAGIDPDAFDATQEAMHAKMEEFRSSGTRPSREEMDAAMGEILEEHGIDQETFRGVMDSVRQQMGAPTHMPEAPRGEQATISSLLSTLAPGAMVDARI